MVSLYYSVTLVPVMAAGATTIAAFAFSLYVFKQRLHYKSGLDANKESDCNVLIDRQLRILPHVIC